MGTTLRAATAPTIPHILVAPCSLRLGFGLLDGTLPVLDRDLLRAGDGELAGGSFAGQRGAGPEGGAGAYRDWRDQLAVAADEGIVADDRLVLVGAVVVAGDGARADVDPGADLGIADIGEVVGFRAFAHAGRLHLDEIADVGAGGKLGARAQACVRADAGLGAHAGAVDMGEGQDLRAGADAGIAQHAVGADARAVRDLGPAFEDAVDVDRDVRAAGEAAAHVDPGRVDQRHAPVEQCVGDAALVDALEFGELALAVDPQGFPGVGRLRGDDRHAVGDRRRDDVGQVVLALGVV